jgi:hypothetical protein
MNGQGWGLWALAGHVQLDLANPDRSGLCVKGKELEQVPLLNLALSGVV